MAAAVAVTLTRVVIGLSWRRLRSRRMAVNEALRLLGGGRRRRAARRHRRERGARVVVCLSEPRGAFGCGHCCCCRRRDPAGAARPLPRVRVPIRAVTERGDALAGAPTFVAPR